MITVTETNRRELGSPEEIAAFLAERYAVLKDAALFEPGAQVRIKVRGGLPPEYGVGDVGVVVCDTMGQPWAQVLLLNTSGMQIVMQMPRDNLEALEAAGE